MIVDSDLVTEQAVRSNPANNPCPKRVLAQQCLLTVHYIGFDGALHRGQIVVHQDITTDIHDFFSLAKDIGFPMAKVVPLAHPDYEWDRDKTVLKDNLTYSFNYRTIQGTDRLSDHAHGTAIDVNPMQNPYVRTKGSERIEWPPVTYDPNTPGTLHADHPLVELMELRGWNWGGRKHHTPEGYDVVDYMHFSKSV